MNRLDLFRRLVSMDTTSSNSNVAMADFIANLYDRRGAEIVRIASQSEPKVNLAIRLGPPGDERRGGLILSGHMDTVPARESDWLSDPFVLTERGENFYARGAADMKGFLALAIDATRGLDSSKLREPLVLIFTYDEEVGCLGARRFVEAWPSDRRLPRNAIIGEPTSLRVVRMHKGHLKLRVAARGKGAHSGYPHLGVNAIEKGARIIEALGRLRRELESERPSHSEHFPEVPYVSLNIATVRGGNAINVVPALCEIEVGIRLLPGMKVDEIMERVRRAVHGVDAAAEVEILSDSPPLLVDREAPIHHDLATRMNQTSTETVSFASDAGWFQTLGIDCVLFGPGSIEVAHRANEFMPREELERGAELIREVIEKETGGHVRTRG